MSSSRSSSARPPLGRRAVAFSVAAGTLLWYALPDGSYDIVRRQEEAVVIWWVIGLGAALGLLPRNRLRQDGLWVLAAFAGLAAWAALGLFWTSSDERTLAEVVRVMHYGGVVLLVLCLISPTTWRPAAAGVFAGAVAVCLLAVASRLFPDQIPDTVAESIGTKRLSYPLGYWNAVGAWGAMTLAMALIWSAHARSLAVRAGSLAAVPLAATVVYLSYSRAGAGGVAVALLAGLALSRNRWTLAAHALVAGTCAAVAIFAIRGRPEIADGTGDAGAIAILAVLVGAALGCALGPLLTRVLDADRRWRVSPGTARVGVGALVAICLLAAVTVGRGPLGDAWDDFRQTGQMPVADSQLRDPASRLTSLEGARYEVWSSAVRALREEPLHGIGAGTFEFHWNTDGGRIFVRDAHSVYLEPAAELGLPGMLLMLAGLVGLAALGVRGALRFRDASYAGAAAALSAAFIVYLFQAGIDWMWEATAVTVLALVAAALGAGIPRRSRLAPTARGRVSLVVVSLLACALTLPGLLSTTKVRASQEAFREQDLGSALSSAESAVSRQPWAASAYVQRALVRWAQGDFPAAASDLRSAREREPENWRHPLLLARLEADRGRAEASAAAFRMAQRLRPASPFLPPG